MGKISVEDQRQISRKIVSVLKSKFIARFGSSHQAAGVVSELNIESSDTKLIRQMKFFIHKTLVIELEKIKGHGNIDYNFVIKLSELSEESISNINMEYDKIAPKEKTSSVAVLLPVIVEAETLVTESPESSLKIIKKIKSQEEESVDSDKYAILMFLNSVVRFEKSLISEGNNEDTKKVKHCWFDEKSDESIYLLHCFDSKTRDIAYEALTWFMGHPSEEDVVNKFKTKDLLLNFSKIRVKDKNPSGVYYCLPPKDGATEEEICKRLRRISVGCFPSVLVLKDGNTFDVTYTKKATSEKMFKLALSMGWDVSSSFDGKSFTCNIKNITSSIVINKEEDVILPEAKEIIVESSVVENEEVSSLLPVAEKELEPPYIFPSVLAGHLVDSKEEALEDLNAIFEDKKSFILLPEEVQRDIILILRKELRDKVKREHPVEYAKHLLNFLNN